MAAQKGHKKHGGRKKGTPNKTTASVKEALRMAFDEMGGVAALKRWAKENLTEFYKLWGRMLPQEVEMSGKNGGPVDLVITEVIVEMPPEESPFPKPSTNGHAAIPHSR